MNSMRLALLGIAAAGAVGVVGVVARAQAPAFDIIETRQAGQDLLSGTYTGILQGVAHQAPVKNFTNPAAAMARWMAQFPSTFPPGSDHGHNTKALPAVWSDRPGFEQAAGNLIAATRKLSALAKADDTAGFDPETFDSFLQWAYSNALSDINMKESKTKIWTPVGPNHAILLCREILCRYFDGLCY